MGDVQLGTHQRGKKKREELQRVLRFMRSQKSGVTEEKKKKGK